MHEPVYYAVLTWHAVLIALLALRVARAKDLVARAIALDTLPYVFVAALAVIAVSRSRVGYLDIGLVIAMLGFAQTIATARFAAPEER